METNETQGILIETPVQKAAHDLYDAEVALHIARQSGVDRWVAAASDRLHAAIERHVLLLNGPMDLPTSA